jgi:hypothetical protein
MDTLVRPANVLPKHYLRLSSPWKAGPRFALASQWHTALHQSVQYPATLRLVVLGLGLNPLNKLATVVDDDHLQISLKREYLSS